MDASTDSKTHEDPRLFFLFADLVAVIISFNFFLLKSHNFFLLLLGPFFPFL